MSILNIWALLSICTGNICFRFAISMAIHRFFEAVQKHALGITHPNVIQIKLKTYAYHNNPKSILLIFD